MGSMGILTFGTDNAVFLIHDEEVPQVYEQTSDAQQNSANIVGNQLDCSSIHQAPALELGGATVNIVSYSPQAAD